MCYVVVKRADKTGSVAIRMHPGEPVIELKRQLKARVDFRYVQVVTISRPSAYGEYEPYRFAETTEEFIRIVDNM